MTSFVLVPKCPNLLKNVKEDNHSNIHLVLALPREVELSSGIDLDNTNFKKGEPIELTHSTLEINPETLKKELKHNRFSGFISDIGTSTGEIASKLGLVASFFASNNQVFLKIFCPI